MGFVDEDNCCPRLPMDILHDILSRLRVKTLCKFLCVSKSWYALISDPIFRSSHDRRTKENPLVIVPIFRSSHDRRTKENPLVIVAKRITYDPTGQRGSDIHIWMLDSKGNLVEKSIIKTEANNIRHILLSEFRTCPDLVFMDDCENVYVCNTITKDLIKMPRRRTDSGKVYRYVLARVPSTKEYKLFAIGFNQPYEVITIGHGCWRTVSNPPVPINTHTFYGRVHVDEAIYMMPEFDDEDSYVKGIVRFDLEREEWSVVPTPSGHSFHGVLSFILRGTGEQLWVAEWSLLGGEKFDLWSLKDHDKGVWMKGCIVRMPFPDPHSCNFFIPLLDKYV